MFIDRVEIREEMRLGIQRLINNVNSSDSRRYCLVNNQMILSLIRGLIMNNIRERLLDIRQGVGCIIIRVNGMVNLIINCQPT